MYRRVLGAFSTALGESNNNVTLATGTRVMEILSTPTMVVESFDAGTHDEISEFVKKVEYAHTKLGKLRGISHSQAMAFESILTIPVTKENFTTQVGQKNYDLVMENLKGFLLIGATIAVIGAIGYVAYKMMTANKKDLSKGVKVAEKTVSMEKSFELFRKIDLSGLDIDAKKKYLEEARKVLNKEANNGITDDMLVTEGWKAFCVSEFYNRQPTYHYWHYLRATEDSWFVNLYLDAAEDFNNSMINLIDELKELKASQLDSTEGEQHALDTLNETEASLTKLEKDRVEGFLKISENYAIDKNDVIQNGNHLFKYLKEDLKRQVNMPVKLIFPLLNDKPKLFAVSISRKAKQIAEKASKLGKELKNASNHIDKEFGKIIDNEDFLDLLKTTADELEILQSLVSDEQDLAASMLAAKYAASKEFSKLLYSTLELAMDPELKRSLAKQAKDAFSELPKTLAREGIDVDLVEEGDGLPEIQYHTSGEIQGVLESLSEYLSLPEYQQAGYRFHPTVGVDGACLMATESWGTGAKIALGIAALVGILGIGALIASTFIKKGSTMSDRHAKPEDLDGVGRFFKEFKGGDAELSTRLISIKNKFENAGLKDKLPLVEGKINELMTYAKAQSSNVVEVDGVKYSVLTYALRNIPKDERFSVGYIYNNGYHLPKSSYLVSGKLFGRVDPMYKNITNLYENVILKAVRDLSMGLSADKVLENINNFKDPVIDRLMSDPIEEFTRLIDDEWYVANGASVSSSWGEAPGEMIQALRETYSRTASVIEQHKTLMVPFEMDDRLVEKFKKLEEANKGTRNDVASVLRRIESYRPVFATFARLARYEQECIDTLLTFADSASKALIAYAKETLSRYKELVVETDKVEKEIDDFLKSKA